MLTNRHLVCPVVVDSTMPAGYWRFLPSFRDDYISLDKMTLGNYLGVCAVIYLTLEEVRLSKTRGHPYSTRCRSCLNLIHTRQAACQDTRPIRVGMGLMMHGSRLSVHIALLPCRSCHVVAFPKAVGESYIYTWSLVSHSRTLS